MFSLGLENIIDTSTKEESFTLDQTEAMLVGIESIQVLNDMQLEIDNCAQFATTVSDIENIVSVIETNGVDKSLLMLFGKELEKIAPSIKDADVSSETLLSELNVGIENIAGKAKEFIKNMIAKFVAFIKKIFTNAPKFISQIDGLTDKAKSSDKEFDGKKEVLGYTYKAKEAAKSMNDDILSVSRSLSSKPEIKIEDAVALINKGLMSSYLSVDDSLKVVVDADFWKKEKKSLDSLGFTSKDMILKCSADIVKGLKDIDNINKLIATDSKLKYDDAVATKVITAKIKLYSLCISTTMSLAVQQISMLKSLV